jgi:hypothetical protein
MRVSEILKVKTKRFKKQLHCGAKIKVEQNSIKTQTQKE